MKLLVLTSEPITAQQLRDALPNGADPRGSEVMVVAPALQDSPLKFWTADADDAIARAERVWRESLDRLEAEGVSAHGDTGESDPVQAVEDALQTFPAERVLLFTHRPSERRYREDVDPEEVADRVGLPVQRVSVG